VILHSLTKQRDFGASCGWLSAALALDRVCVCVCASLGFLLGKLLVMPFSNYVLWSERPLLVPLPKKHPACNSFNASCIKQVVPLSSTAATDSKRTIASLGLNGVCVACAAATQHVYAAPPAASLDGNP
jgi:hypothetical protein